MTFDVVNQAWSFVKSNSQISAYNFHMHIPTQKATKIGHSNTSKSQRPTCMTFDLNFNDFETLQK